MADLNLQTFRRGWFVVEAVQLTPDNGPAVWEWANSKPFYGPAHAPGQALPITGLTIFTTDGRVKANFGDWVYRAPGGSFKVREDDNFRELFQPAEGAAPGFYASVDEGR